ncbi:MAG: HK97 family phage prohead protease [Treponema sp.]|jgi:HK97 family phage prohead protease|nr:HK97 family phage prohead protease [Treponema sp.]
MLIRTKIGEYRADNASVLLDFLGVKKEAAGPQAVTADVELIAAVPFALSAGRDKTGDGIAAIPNGIAWTLSTFDLDRFSERIDPAGWDFKRYMDNPVIEWAHRYDIPAIGKADSLYADEKGLHGLIIFNDKDYDPFGWAIGQRVKAGVIRAGSVGFRPIEIEIPDKETAKDGTTLIFRKQELLEFSICNVPANPFALSKGLGANKAAAGFPEFWGNIITNHTGGING